MAWIRGELKLAQNTAVQPSGDYLHLPPPRRKWDPEQKKARSGKIIRRESSLTKLPPHQSHT